MRRPPPGGVGRGAPRLRATRAAASASWAAGGAFLLTALTGPAAAIWPFDDLGRPAPLEQRAAELLSDAIRISTVNPPGNEAALSRLLADRLDRAGIDHEVIPTPTAEGDPPRAALWARLEGRGDRPALVLLSHLDTVPADPEGWSGDPFSGEIHGGFVWGRGALDAKGVAVTQLLALLELAQEDALLERDLILLATPEEETGGAIGAGWLVAERPDLFAGAGFLLTEGGGIQVASGGDDVRPPIWGVSVTEKAPCWIELRARGRSGHSAAPSPDAAVPRLVAALDRIRRVESPVRVLDEVARMFRRLAPLAPAWDRAGYRDLRHHLETDEAFRRRFLGDPSQNALVRNTVSITVLQGASKINVAPAMARAQLDARLLPGEPCDGFAAALDRVVDDPAVEIEELLSFPARASSSETPLFRAIETLAARRDPEAVVVPRMITGFTDAHWFRELGLVAYGFVPRALTADEARRVHGVDERISTANLARSIRLTTELVRTFDTLEAETGDRSGPPAPPP